MDTRSRDLMDYLSETMNHTDVSGFELLEILDVRSRLATREPLLNDEDKTQLESLDRTLVEMAEVLLERISEVADLAEMRHRAHVLPSHWWWYLDQIASLRRKAAG